MSVVESVEALPREELEPDGQYLVSAGRLCRRRQTKDGPIVEPLCNFAARVTEELTLDDGAETSRAFILEGQLADNGHLPAVRVPVARFNGMSWVTEQWGLRAVVRAGLSTRDHLRAAIQELSPGARCRHVFTHTGWRQLGEQWVYLTASGAVSATGYEVDLGPDLARYALPLVPDDPAGAMRASVDLLRAGIAPMRVMAPLWGATFRAPTASALPVDVSLWLEGTTGSLKSTITALVLSHYGEFDRLHLPGAWTSTANQLERRAFLLKDAVFVIDDYAPSATDVRELELKAGRLLRSAGNGAGRGRLRADLTERPAYPPRGIIIVTGEQHPPGQSILARSLVTELDGAAVNLPALTAAQATAKRLPHALAGFISWLAPQMATLPRTLAEGFATIRQRAAGAGSHLRVPEAVAHLYVGIDLGLTYARGCGACSDREAAELAAAAWAALTELSIAQGKLITSERPSHRFLHVLLTLVQKKLGVLLDRETHEDGPRADLLGWQDSDSLYLLPGPTWAAVAKLCRDAGEPFPIREERLRADLEKEGLCDGDRERRTAVVKIAGRPRRVLRLHRHKAEAIVGEEFPSPPVTEVTGRER
jgi:hypothetical protein